MLLYASQIFRTFSQITFSHCKIRWALPMCSGSCHKPQHLLYHKTCFSILHTSLFCFLWNHWKSHISRCIIAFHGQHNFTFLSGDKLRHKLLRHNLMKFMYNQIEQGQKFMMIIQSNDLFYYICFSEIGRLLHAYWGELQSNTVDVALITVVLRFQQHKNCYVKAASRTFILNS